MIVQAFSSQSSDEIVGIIFCNEELDAEIGLEYIKNPISEELYVYDTWADITKIQNETGCEPTITLKESILRVCSQYK